MQRATFGSSFCRLGNNGSISNLAATEAVNDVMAQQADCTHQHVLLTKKQFRAQSVSRIACCGEGRKGDRLGGTTTAVTTEGRRARPLAGCAIVGIS